MHPSPSTTVPAWGSLLAVSLAAALNYLPWRTKDLRSTPAATLSFPQQSLLLRAEAAQMMSYSHNSQQIVWEENLEMGWSLFIPFRMLKAQDFLLFEKPDKVLCSFFLPTPQWVQLAGLVACPPGRPKIIPKDTNRYVSIETAGHSLP